MSSPKSEKIDLNTDYPCPCGRRGRLVPITLTEAFGCNKCQQIFVVEENGQVIEQLSTTYPYKKAWLWTGSRWQRAHSGLKEHYLPLTIVILLVPLVIWLPLAWRSASGSANIVPWVLLALILAVLPALILWLAYRR
ncbi:MULTISPECIES: hypothetical protein [Microseira]|uniref:hypothetical protein n=1 Tax=Microseira TaxID=1609595 RepID=UPI001CFF382F|nr:hypothetical protein [Microseira wollei]